MIKLLVRAALAAVTLSFGLASQVTAESPEGPTNQQQQGLVGGDPVDVATQEKLGLLSLASPGGSCSASLLRNNWAITAAHCVETTDANGNVINYGDSTFTLKAAWAVPQQRQSMRVITFRPYDIAIIRVATPFTVNGSTTNYIRDIFRDGQFPYFGQLTPVPITAYGRGIVRFAQNRNGVAMPSVRDGKYRSGAFKTRTEGDNRYWYPSTSGQMIAGGDSGGPSFALVRGADTVLMGVHSATHANCLSGQTCIGNDWTWISDTYEAGDAPIAPVWDDINRYMGAFVSQAEPAQEPPPPGFIGTFGITPPNYQPMWVYAIKNTGELMWYRKESGNAAWQGAKQVGNGWAGGMKDVIAGGGNTIYTLTSDGTVRWYRHDGFNDGTFKWTGPVEVARGWNYAKIFSGGEGIIYAIKDDGTLVWYRHNGYLNGGGAATMSAPRVVGSGWSGQRDIFAAGSGAIYVVRQDGTLSYYTHTGYATGEPTWSTPRNVGTGWNSFKQIVSAGNGVILGIQEDGKVLWYKHLGLTRSVSFARLKETWEGRTQIGSGWQGFFKVFALLPAPPQAPR